MRCLLFAVAACGPAVTVHPERAAPTCGGEVVLATQSDVAGLAGCTDVRSLSITGDVSLGPLGRLASVTGDLVVRGALRELVLPRLTSVGGALVIADNAGLARVALRALTRAGRLELTDNPQLAVVDLGAATFGEDVRRGNPLLPAP